MGNIQQFFAEGDFALDESVGHLVDEVVVDVAVQEAQIIFDPDDDGIIGMQQFGPLVDERLESGNVVVVERIGFALEVVEDSIDLLGRHAEVAVVEASPVAGVIQRLLGDDDALAALGAGERTEVSGQLAGVATSLAETVEEFRLFEVFAAPLRAVQSERVTGGDHRAAADGHGRFDGHSVLRVDVAHRVGYAVVRHQTRHRVDRASVDPVVVHFESVHLQNSTGLLQNCTFYQLIIMFGKITAEWPSGQRCKLASVGTRVRFQPKPRFSSAGILSFYLRSALSMQLIESIGFLELLNE